MADIFDKPITVTLSGAEWTAVLARILGTYRFSKLGAKTYNAAATKLQKQILEQANGRPDNS